MLVIETGDTQMAYFELQNHRNEKIGGRFYFELDLARAVAKRTVSRWNKSNVRRGDAIKIVRYDGSLYPTVTEWVAA